MASSSDVQKAESAQAMIKSLLEGENADYARAIDLVDRLIRTGHHLTLERYQPKRAKIIDKQLPKPTPCEHLAILLEWKAIIAAHLNQDLDVAYQHATDAVVFHKRGKLVNVEQIVPIIAKGLYRQGPAYRNNAIATYKVGYFHPDVSEEWKKAHEAIVEQWITESNAAKEKVDKKKTLDAAQRTQRENQRQRERPSKKEHATRKADKRLQKEDAKVKEGFCDPKNDNQEVHN